MTQFGRKASKYIELEEQPLIMNQNRNDESNSLRGRSPKKSSPVVGGTAPVAVPDETEKIGFRDRLLGRTPYVARTIPLMEQARKQSANYPPNKIRNQKYRAWSFIFVVLFNQVFMLSIFYLYFSLIV